MSVAVRFREFLLPVLLFPLVLPVLVLASSLTAAALAERAAPALWWAVFALYDWVFVLLGLFRLRLRAGGLSMISALVALSVAVAAGWLVWVSLDVERRVASARGVGAATLAALALWLGLVVFYAPIEQVQGLVQKIFYVHIPAIIPTYLGFTLTAVGGVAFLRTRRESWDQLALGGAEVGVVFCSLMLIVGPIWAKPVWGHWWVWDLRLTSTLILWFIYVAYLFLRGLAFGSDAARTFTSVYGIIGTAAIPFVYFAVDIAQGSTMHPSNPAREGLPGRDGADGRRRAHRVRRRLRLAGRAAHAGGRARGSGARERRAGRRLMAYLLAAYAVTGVVLVGYALRLRAARLALIRGTQQRS